jgi:hypothetical protein
MWRRDFGRLLLAISCRRLHSWRAHHRSHDSRAPNVWSATEKCSSARYCAWQVAPVPGKQPRLAVYLWTADILQGILKTRDIVRGLDAAATPSPSFRR